MHSDDTRGRRIPSLVSICQRVAIAHVDSICNLGSEITFDLAKPILERCTAEQLLRIEESSPHLQCETYDLWMVLCSHRYPKSTQLYLLGEAEDSETWKERYFTMEIAEARRLEELGNRLRSQRQEADERKREREIKLTDRLPPPKRPKTGWPALTQPKSLFQKTRSEASRIQRAVYNARVIPPMHTVKNYSLSTKSAIPDLLPPAQNADNQPSRVTVNVVRRPIKSSTHTVIHNPSLPLLASSVKVPTSEDEPPPMSEAVPGQSEKCPLIQSSSLSSLSDLPNGNKTVKSPKKDPMACLFLPKHRPRPTKV